jgi:putative transposase
VRRAFRFLLRPIARQQIALTAMLDDHRALYNAALQERRDAWRMCGVSVRYGEQSAQLNGCRWDSVTGEHRVYLQGVGHVRVHQHRPIAGWVKTISVRREGRHWYVLVSCDDVPARRLRPLGGRWVSTWASRTSCELGQVPDDPDGQG